MSVLWLNVLYCLPMLSVYVDSNNSFVEVGIGRLQYGVVNMVKVVECVEAFEDEFEQGLQIFRTRRCDENVAVAMGNLSCDCNTQRGRFSSSSIRCAVDCASQRLLGNGVNNCTQGLGLVDRFCYSYA